MKSLSPKYQDATRIITPDIPSDEESDIDEDEIEELIFVRPPQPSHVVQDSQGAEGSSTPDVRAPKHRSAVTLDDDDDTRVTVIDKHAAKEYGDIRKNLFNLTRLLWLAQGMSGIPCLAKEHKLCKTSFFLCSQRVCTKADLFKAKSLET